MESSRLSHLRSWKNGVAIDRNREGVQGTDQESRRCPRDIQLEMSGRPSEKFRAQVRSPGWRWNE